MKKLSFLKISFLTFFLAVSAIPANATVINVLEPVYVVTSGVWSVVPPTAPTLPGTAEIVDLTGQGGNLENNVPLGTGAVKLSTDGGGDQKAEIRIDGNFGTVGDFINHGSLSYDYFHVSGGPSSTVVPAIKLEFIDFTPPNFDFSGTFIYEPYYNRANPADPLNYDDWYSATVTGDSGNLWHTGIYNQNGFVFENTLSEWKTEFDNLFGPTFFDARIFSISLGLGSGTPGETGYVDNVQFRSIDADGNPLMLSADFESLEVAAVPLPAALPLYGTGVALLGLLGWRKRRNR